MPEKLVTHTNKQGAEYRVLMNVDEDTETKSAVPVPSTYDNKAAWVDYAVAMGNDRDTAEALTKAELIETYG